jgi:hypothetical protein
MGTPARTFGASDPQAVLALAVEVIGLQHGNLLAGDRAEGRLGGPDEVEAPLELVEGHVIVGAGDSDVPVDLGPDLRVVLVVDGDREARVVALVTASGSRALTSWRSSAIY